MPTGRITISKELLMDDLTIQQEEFLTNLEGMVGSLRFEHPGKDPIKGFCIITTETFEEEAGAFDRKVITTATSYKLERSDFILVYHNDPVGTKGYRIGPNISANPDLEYKAVLDEEDFRFNEDEDDPQEFKEVVYGSSQQILKAGTNITLEEDDEDETITISAGATSIADKSITERQLSDELDGRLLPSVLGDAGQVVAVNGDADGVEWVDPMSGPPGPMGLPGRDSTVPGPPGKDSTVPGPMGLPGRDGIDGTSLTINYRKVAKNGTNWTDLVTGSNYNADYIYRITAIVNSDHTETVSIKGGDLALASGSNGLKMFIRNNARSCDIRLSNGTIQARLDDTATCTFTVMWAPIAITTIS